MHLKTKCLQNILYLEYVSQLNMVLIRCNSSSVDVMFLLVPLPEVVLVLLIILEMYILWTSKIPRSELTHPVVDIC